MTLTELHARLGNAGMLFALALGLWGLVLYFRRQGPTGGLLGGMVIGEVLFVLQGILGGILYGQGRPIAQGVHILYGVLSVITLPAAYAFTRGNTDRRTSLIYSVIGFFLFGVALRAISTAR